MNILCIICTESITDEELESMYITRCGHIFHYQCLAQWTQRSPCCPQCRKKVTKKLMFRMYPTLSDDPSYDNKLTESLLNTQQQLNAQIEDKDAKLAALRKDLENSKKLLDKYKNELASMKSEMRGQLGKLEEQKKITVQLQKDIERGHHLNFSKNLKYDKKLTALQDKYRYQVKRNIEWRKLTKKKHLDVCRDSFLKEGCRKRRKNSTSSSDSLTDSDSPVSTDNDSECTCESDCRDIS